MATKANLVSTLESSIKPTHVTYVLVLAWKLLDIQSAVINACRMNPRKTKEYVAHFRVTKGIWYLTLKNLLAIDTQTSEKSDMKEKSLKIWRNFGLLFKWHGETSQASSTSHTASELSNQLAYWRIPKHCFAKACFCSTGDPHHYLHVCKGCWRVLYCSKKCQRL